MDTIQQPAQQLQERELTTTEMMFLVSAYFYIEASTLAQQALETKNPAFIVIKQENDPTVREEVAKTAAEREELRAAHPDLDSDTIPGPDDATDEKGNPVNPVP